VSSALVGAPAWLIPAEVALSGLFGGMLVGWLGWTAAFLGLAVPGAVALALALWLAKAVADTKTTDAAPHLQGSQAG